MKKLRFLCLAVVCMMIMTLLISCAAAKHSEPFDFDGNAIPSEAVIDGVDDDELWQDENRVVVRFATSVVTVVRRSQAIYLFFKTMDQTPYRYVGSGDDTEVTRSDSVEFYFDSKLTRTSKPAANDYQINLGRDSRTRICSGTGWLKWMALYSFEVREGDTAEDYDYYYVEAMLPVAQMNIGATEAVGIAFGQVDRFVDSNVDVEQNFTWTGLHVGGKLVDPQIPSTYMVLCPSSLEPGQANRLYNYDEYVALSAKEGA